MLALSEQCFPLELSWVLATLFTPPSWTTCWTSSSSTLVCPAEETSSWLNLSPYKEACWVILVPSYTISKFTERRLVSSGSMHSTTSGTSTNSSGMTPVGDLSSSRLMTSSWISSRTRLGWTPSFSARIPACCILAKT